MTTDTSKASATESQDKEENKKYSREELVTWCEVSAIGAILFVKFLYWLSSLIP